MHNVNLSDLTRHGTDAQTERQTDGRAQCVIRPPSEERRTNKMSPGWRRSVCATAAVAASSRRRRGEVFGERWKWLT